VYRVFILTLISISFTYAESYESLLQLALEQNNALKITQTKEEQVRLRGAIERRMENPNLELELADFSAKRVFRENELGARVGVSQSILLPSLKSDQKRLTETLAEVEQEQFKLEKSAFVYRFNRLYLAYKKLLRNEQIAQEALLVSDEILSIVEARFHAGSIAKSELIEAQIERKELLNQLKRLSLEQVKAKNSLLLFANLQNVSEISTAHSFMKVLSSSTNPTLALTKKREAVAEAKGAVASHTIERIELFSELEAEPDQDIFRVGVAIPLPIFNQKSEEKQLAKIASQNQKMLLSTQERALTLELSQLHHEITLQEELKEHYRALMVEQEELLGVYQEGYAIAKVNLLKLNNVKKSLLKSKEELLDAEIAIERNIIKINYLQGAYNE
jgi:cobalt-zinc-cadmium efflux system outer membrane protein